MAVDAAGQLISAHVVKEIEQVAHMEHRAMRTTARNTPKVCESQTARRNEIEAGAS